jgi:hypothetical protein
MFLLAFLLVVSLSPLALAFFLFRAYIPSLGGKKMDKLIKIIWFIAGALGFFAALVLGEGLWIQRQLSSDPTTVERGRNIIGQVISESFGIILAALAFVLLALGLAAYHRHKQIERPSQFNHPRLPKRKD